MRIVHEAPDAIFQVDEENSIFSFTWKGLVSEQSVTKIFSIASRAASVMDSTHWLIDRRDLEGYSPEARIWLKTRFIQDLGQELIKKTDKIAAVNSNSALAQVSSSVLIEAMKQHNADIDYKEYDDPVPAKNWLLGLNDSSKAEEKKKRGFFRRG